MEKAGPKGTSSIGADICGGIEGSSSAFYLGLTQQKKVSLLTQVLESLMLLLSVNYGVLGIDNIYNGPNLVEEFKLPPNTHFTCMRILNFLKFQPTANILRPGNFLIVANQL